jgi:MFS family permease
VGRKPLLIAGWLIGLPVPLLVMVAPSWDWIVAANVLLGVNQGLCWSATVIMKIDLAGPARRGLAMGLNECAGYLAFAGAAWLSGYLATALALRPWPFVPGLLCAVLGLGLSILFVRETRAHAQQEAGLRHDPAVRALPFRQVFLQVSWRERALSAVSQAGLVNNLNDGMAWGLFPLFFAAHGLPLDQIGVLAAIYPAVWGIGQIGAGALSDRWGRKGLIVAGMEIQAAGIGLILLTRGFGPWAVGAGLLGLGTALVYPTLLAAIGDVAAPASRATAVGVYRLWRDLGYAVGAVLAGIVADRLGLAAAIAGVAGLTAASGLLVAVRMYETHRPAQRSGRPVPTRDEEGPRVPDAVAKL